MSVDFPRVVLARHGETPWTLTRQHTGVSDIPLTARGERNARRLAGRLADLVFAEVLVSPLARARRTCELAGYGPVARIDPDLAEMNYGQYEGRTTAEIHQERPDWDLFRDGCPGGETVDDVAQRADRVIAHLRGQRSDVLIFSHAHFMRVLAARWLLQPPREARCYLLSTASISVLGYEHNRQQQVIRAWNDDRHVGD